MEAFPHSVSCKQPVLRGKGARELSRTTLIPPSQPGVEGKKKVLTYIGVCSSMVPTWPFAASVDYPTTKERGISSRKALDADALPRTGPGTVVDHLVFPTAHHPVHDHGQNIIALAEKGSASLKTPSGTDNM